VELIRFPQPESKVVLWAAVVFGGDLSLDKLKNKSARHAELRGDDASNLIGQPGEA